MAAANFFSYAPRTLVVSSRCHDISEDIGRKGRGDIVGVYTYKNVDFLDDTKKNINKTSRRRGSGFFFLPRFFFFLVTLVEGEEAKGKRCRAGGKLRDLLNKRFFSIELS